MSQPTQLTSSRASLQSGDFYAEYPTDGVDAALLDSLGSYYKTAGDGNAYVVVTYDPKSRTNTAKNAAENLARIQSHMRSMGVNTLTADILPIMDQGENSIMVVDFKSLSVIPPKDCDMMPGFNGADTNLIPQYEIGCSTELLFSQQIARPSDLLGNEAEPGDNFNSRAYKGNLGYFYNDDVPNSGQLQLITTTN